MHNDDLIPNPPSVENTDSSTVPPNSATVDFVADADRQGIFSSSDTRIETENLPEVPEVVQQAPSSSISPTLRTTSTVTGDLQLGDNTKKKKWPLIAVGVIAIIALAAGGWALLGGPKGEDGAYRKARAAFLEYANFVLDGRKSTDMLDDSCLAEKSCYFLQAMRDKDQSHAFFEEAAAAKGKLDEAVNAWIDILAAGDEAPENEANSATIAHKMQDLVDLHEFLDIYQAHGMLKKSDIVDYFLANGSADIQDYISGYYGSGHDDNAYLNDLKESVSAMSMAVLANIDIYAQHGCMTGLMNEACFVASVTEEEKALVAENNQIIADYGSEADAYADMPYSLLGGIIKINDLLNLEQK